MPRTIVLTGDDDVSRWVADAVGGETTLVTSTDAAYEALVDESPDLAVLEVAAEDLDEREELLVGLLARPARPAVVLLAAPQARGVAATLVERGAHGVLALPLDATEARAVLRRALAHATLERERARAFHDCEALRRFVRDVVTSVPGGVLVVDGGLVALEVNDEAARLLGVERSALVGSRLDPSAAAPIVRLLEATRKEGGRSAADLEMRAGTRTVRLHGTASLIRDHAERPVGGLVVLRERR